LGRHNGLSLRRDEDPSGAGDSNATDEDGSDDDLEGKRPKKKKKKRATGSGGGSVGSVGSLQGAKLSFHGGRPNLDDTGI
jgi:hypothetical protein